ncbi:hypothetical protein PVAP13_7KG077027 [Panicum virgatum]|uniref:Uncharacterized protein n=1 Tax=Panicum virgatum TaxID=38727 RepID=A0A8T0Q7K1_PANVG|nr:hypothetical protein PVAP13_7KG077027 [Panicum virgatum]
MEPSDPVPAQSVDVQRGSPQVHLSSMDTGQWLVDRMPSNPKKMAFISTQERFEVPLRPELWSSVFSPP